MLHLLLCFQLSVVKKQSVGCRLQCLPMLYSCSMIVSSILVRRRKTSFSYILVPNYFSIAWKASLPSFFFISINISWFVKLFLINIQLLWLLRETTKLFYHYVCDSFGNWAVACLETSVFKLKHLLCHNILNSTTCFV